jgi:hypothetical protein
METTETTDAMHEHHSAPCYPLTGHPADSAITIRRPTPEALRKIADNLSQADRAELAALGLQDAHRVIREAVRQCREAYVASWDGEPQAVFGVSDHAQSDRIGIPWMLSTGTGSRHASEFMDISRKVIAAWSPMYLALANIVSEQHHTARRWLEALGFTPLATHAINGQNFDEMVRQHV